MNKNEIIPNLPYTKPFLFVDTIDSLDEDSVSGSYFFAPDLWFYKGHFKGHPVTPGVILTECMAQIGLASLGIYLLDNNTGTYETKIALTSTDVEFLKPVLPGETVIVISKKVYFRFGKLKCRIEMIDNDRNIIAKGVLAGMILKNQ
ncbi:3-hydroxyacyl-ACP dehydratase FabZ family protein [Christiangramia salexigens]|uniref:Hydroxymyristoyl-ACP dehydratase n=1 Tax=Christiangramia salexigens TaxID=1913577 RepID=A0A1L3J374_9FLAO|nr:FabA/FabZ family ACP-dehydratase [Christiangramia salexigens]APG59553.1 hydroxymyristoyl-ACP dehydratase [Christiangramia salexigens]